MIQIEIEDFGKAIAFVNELKKRFRDLRPFWRRILTPLVIAEIEEIFQTEGRGRWASLNPDYEEKKAARTSR